MDTLAIHYCPLHAKVQCLIRFTLISTDGDFVFCSACHRCAEYGHTNPTNWIVLNTTSEELSLYLKSGQPELRDFYINHAVQTEKRDDGQG